jgi:hypothetical protein
MSIVKDKKFVEVKDLSDWEIETDNGWSPISRIGKTIQYEKWIIKTKSHSLECADEHVVFLSDMSEIYAKDLKPDDVILTLSGPEPVTSITNTHELIDMYDVEVADENHRFYFSGILSHNTLWLGNLAAEAVRMGNNVAILSFEMSDRKYLKRIGSNMLGIPMSSYKNSAEDTEMLKKKIQSLAFDNLRIPGQLFVKEFPTSQVGVPDIERYLTKLEERKGIKLKIVVVDYINILKNWRNPNTENTYMKIKQIAEDLRGMAMKHDWCIITATQTKACLTPDSELISKQRGIITLAELQEGEIIRGRSGWTKVLKKHDPEIQPVYEIELWCGKKIKASAHHRWPVLAYHQAEGYHLYETHELLPGQHLFVSEGDTSKIEGITLLEGHQETIDITVDAEDRLFFANQILTHNSEFDSSDLSIGSASESSGLVATVDGMFGIIQDPMMHANREYRLKVLANREEGYKNAYKKFIVDYNYMRIREDIDEPMHTE